MFCWYECGKLVFDIKFEDIKFYIDWIWLLLKNLIFDIMILSCFKYRFNLDICVVNLEWCFFVYCVFKVNWKIELFIVFGKVFSIKYVYKFS